MLLQGSCGSSRWLLVLFGLCSLVLPTLPPPPLSLSGLFLCMSVSLVFRKGHRSWELRPTIQDELILRFLAVHLCKDPISSYSHILRLQEDMSFWGGTTRATVSEKM